MDSLAFAQLPNHPIPLFVLTLYFTLEIPHSLEKSIDFIFHWVYLLAMIFFHLLHLVAQSIIFLSQLLVLLMQFYYLGLFYAGLLWDDGRIVAGHHAILLIRVNNITRARLLVWPCRKSRANSRSIKYSMHHRSTVSSSRVSQIGLLRLHKSVCSDYFCWFLAWCFSESVTIRKSVWGGSCSLNEWSRRVTV